MICWICVEDEPLDKCSICGNEICHECSENTPEVVCDLCGESVVDIIEESR